jgi:hypothetical protein
MADEEKSSGGPTKILLREVKGGASRELGEVPLKEAFKPLKPSYLQAPVPVAVPQAGVNVLEKGAKSPKPAGQQVPKPVVVPVPPQPPMGNGGVKSKK